MCGEALNAGSFKDVLGGDSLQISNNFFDEIISAFLPLLNGPKLLTTAFDKAKLLQSFFMAFVSLLELI